MNMVLVRHYVSILVSAVGRGCSQESASCHSTDRHFPEVAFGAGFASPCSLSLLTSSVGSTRVQQLARPSLPPPPPSSSPLPSALLHHLRLRLLRRCCKPICWSMHLLGAWTSRSLRRPALLHPCFLYTHSCARSNRELSPVTESCVRKVRWVRRCCIQ